MNTAPMDDGSTATAYTLETPAASTDVRDDSAGCLGTQSPAEPSISYTVLLLCAGPNERDDSLYNLLRKVPGINCINYDIANGTQFDIVDDTVWDRLITAVSALEYVACFASPPCSSYSCLHLLPGPPPLRDATGPGRYGRSDLSPRSKEHVRKHTLISTRVAHVLGEFVRLCRPWLFEAPWASEKQTSSLNLDEYQKLLALDGVNKQLGYQCPFGGLAPKPSAWVSYRMDLKDMPHSCPHSVRQWYNQRTGEMVSKRHAPSRGKDVFLLHRNSLAPRDRPWPKAYGPGQNWISEKLAAYPPLLNRYIVAALRIGIYNNGAATERGAGSTTPASRFCYSHGFAERIVWRDPLRGALTPTEKEAADELAIGGLRDTAAAVGRLSKTADFGFVLGADIRHLLATQHVSSSARTQHSSAASWIDATCDLIGASKDSSLSLPTDAVAAVRELIIQHIGMIDYDDYVARTKVDAPLLRQWQRASGDPDAIAAGWMIDGAPMGVTLPLEDPGIFPPAVVEPSLQHANLHCDLNNFRNYSGVEESDITETEIKAHLAKDHLASFRSIDDLRTFVNGEPILNKLGLITKVRNGISKTRMILDTKESWVKHATWKAQRVILPRLYDAVLRLLSLMAVFYNSGLAPAVEAFVLDFTDAFWQVPVRPEEHRFYCATATLDGEKRYLAFLRAAQGSTNGPTLWARVIALVCRLTQSLFTSDEMRLMCYVDDPLAAMSGTPEQRRLMTATIILVWSVLGFQLAFAKGQLSQTVTWIGGTLRCEQWGVHATVKESIVSDICADLKRLQGQNLISKKDLHSLIGKLSHAAGLLIIMRPFLEPLWAALASDEKASGAPRNTVWRKQIRQSMIWFEALFLHQPTLIERRFTIEAFLRVGSYVEIGTDASPWGMGGWLQVDGKITEYFACEITEADLNMFGLSIGTPEGQQVWECLAVLVALDLWTSRRTDARINLQVRSDNVTALTLLVKMRPGSPNIAIIAREIALRLVEFSFPPDAMHTPGIAHILADDLSRIHAPGGIGDAKLYRHAALADATLAHPPARGPNWYRAYNGTPPTVSAASGGSMATDS